MEKVKWISKSGQAKSLGTLVSIAGAFVVTFYKGPPVIKTISLHSVLSLVPLLSPQYSSWILGGIFLADDAFLISGWYILQDTSAWKLRLDMGLVAILYSAIIGSGLRVCLVTWCLSSIGPLHVSMFKPLAIVFSIVMDIIFLGEPLCLGSLIGAVIIVAGFYYVMWGNLLEENTIDHHDALWNSNSSSQKVPLLKNRIENMYNTASVTEVSSLRV
ncbi:hypothetical protein Pint_23046 [Pistacia integerrima]|uniref:Uncharacterized protein n=1 Tax=Pistacia integerrima TaxID=434235 RepID=A0ACC0YHE6_9ROSI|nr:hypothetical protein Pint_23046 [Pistacia integerrima]